MQTLSQDHEGYPKMHDYRPTASGLGRRQTKKMNVKTSRYRIVELGTPASAKRQENRSQKGAQGLQTNSCPSIVPSFQPANLWGWAQSNGHEVWWGGTIIPSVRPIRSENLRSSPVPWRLGGEVKFRKIIGWYDRLPCQQESIERCRPDLSRIPENLTIG